MKLVGAIGNYRGIYPEAVKVDERMQKAERHLNNN